MNKENNELDNKEVEALEEKLPKKKRKKIQPPHLSLGEEVGNSITHGVGAIFALVGFILLLLKSDTPIKILATCFYGISMFLTMLMSCLYHSFKWGSTVKRVFRRFDYSSIYLLIGGTFSPILLIFWGNTIGIVWFIVQWILIIAGITIVAVFGPGRFRWFHFTLYFVMGWSGIAFVPGMIERNIPLFIGILIGGLLYTIGMIPFSKKGIRYSHFIWHFFVLLAAIVHYIAIYLNIY